MTIHHDWEQQPAASFEAADQHLLEDMSEHVQHSDPAIRISKQTSVAPA